MSVCSATAAATRPGARRESRGSSARASTSDAQFFLDRSGRQYMEHRKYSTCSKTKSSGNLCCVISVLLAIAAIAWLGSNADSVGWKCFFKDTRIANRWPACQNVIAFLWKGIVAVLKEQPSQCTGTSLL